MTTNALSCCALRKKAFLTGCSRYSRMYVVCNFLFFCLPGLLLAQGPASDDEFRRASEAMREGKLDEAGDRFAEIARRSPSFAEAYLNLGLVREEQGRSEEAIASVQKALALKPRLRGANLFLGIAEYQLNQLDKAVSALHKETANYPMDAGAWMWLGVAELARERPEEAAQSLDKAAKLAPDNVDILYQRGRAHLLVSKNSYARMFKADPNSWHVHQVLAQADAESDRYEEAIAEYQVAIKLAPNQPGLHEELGVQYQKAGKLEQAEVELRRELEIDPHNVLATYKLGTLRVELGDAAQGKAFIEGALTQNPHLKDARYYLGRAEMQLGNDSVAIEALKHAVSEDSDPEIVQQAWYQLGIVYRRTHRVAEAQQAMQMFQKLKDEEAEHLRESLQKKREAQGTNNTPSAPPTNR
jgi:tetratricopeptide (TPR) repeat protein